MTRAATSFPDEWAPLLAKRVEEEGRSESNYIMRLIEQDLKEHGLLKSEPTEFETLYSLVVAAATEDPAIKTKLVKLIPAALRGKRVA